MAGLGLAAATLGATGARAQSAADVTAARDLFIEGSELAEQGRWSEARERYERSLALKRAAITLYSLGVAQKSTGRLVEALESFRAFLAEASSPATSHYEAAARAAVAELEKRIARLDVTIEPAVPGVTVHIDGAAVPAAALGRARVVDPGAHVVAAVAAGWREARAEVKLAEGERASVKLVLERVPASVLGGAARGNGSAGAGASPALLDGASGRALPVVLIAGGGALLGAGIGLGLAGVSNASRAPTRDGAVANEARTMAMAGDILAGVGVGVAAAGGIVLWLRSSRGTTAAAISPWIGAGSFGVSGQF